MRRHGPIPAIIAAAVVGCGSFYPTSQAAAPSDWVPTYSQAAVASGGDSPTEKQAPVGDSKGTIEARLEQLQELHNRSLITNEEYRQRRKEILQEL